MTQGDDMCPVCYDRTDAELRTVPGVIYSKESNCPECSRAALRAEVGRLTAELAQARRTAEFWKASHLRGNAEVARLTAERDALREALEEIHEVCISQKNESRGYGRTVRGWVEVRARDALNNSTSDQKTAV